MRTSLAIVGVLMIVAYATLPIIVWAGWWLWLPCGLLAIAGTVWYYLAELHGPDNQRASRKPNVPYNTRTMPYREYLLTPEWRTISQMAIDRDGHKCTKCGSTERLQVHHKTYARRGVEKRKDLVTLCRRCHEAEHRRL